MAKNIVSFDDITEDGRLWAVRYEGDEDNILDVLFSQWDDVTWLRKFQSSTLSQWRQNAKARLASQEERRKARKVAMQMLNAMEHQGITEPALAERLGISTTELSSILKGHKLPSSVMLSSIASVLGIALASMM